MKHLNKHWKKYAILLVVVAAFFLVGPKDDGKYDEFASCLTEKGATMFGAYWCGHCAEQKKMFGSSFDNVNYVECSLPGGQGQTEVCEQEGITGYPTWEFADGERLPGRVPLETLSEKTGCALP